MPRNVRNFWIELDVDGSKKQIASGPQNKEGGFSLIIRQRDKGDIVTAAKINGFANADGRIRLEVETCGAEPISFVTVR